MLGGSIVIFMGDDNLQSSITSDFSAASWGDTSPHLMNMKTTLSSFIFWPTIPPSLPSLHVRVPWNL